MGKTKGIDTTLTHIMRMRNIKLSIKTKEAGA